MCILCSAEVDFVVDFLYVSVKVTHPFKNGDFQWGLSTFPYVEFRLKWHYSNAHLLGIVTIGVHAPSILSVLRICEVFNCLPAFHIRSTLQYTSTVSLYHHS